MLSESCCAAVAEWQTRTFEGRVGNTVLVRVQSAAPFLSITMCRRDGIGRRAGFKIPWWQHRMGSTPIAGTMYDFQEDMIWVDKVEHGLLFCSWF